MDSWESIWEYVVGYSLVHLTILSQLRSFVYLTTYCVDLQASSRAVVLRRESGWYKKNCSAPPILTCDEVRAEKAEETKTNQQARSCQLKWGSIAAVEIEAVGVGEIPRLVENCGDCDAMYDNVTRSCWK